MKVLLPVILAAGLIGSGAAFAEKSVKIPTDLNDARQVALYTAALKRAVKAECQRDATPVIGLNYYRYMACIKDTTAWLARAEPTGLFAAKEGLTTTLASR